MNSQISELNADHLFHSFTHLEPTNVSGRVTGAPIVLCNYIYFPHYVSHSLPFLYTKCPPLCAINYNYCLYIAVKLTNLRRYLLLRHTTNIGHCDIKDKIVVPNVTDMVDIPHNSAEKKGFWRVDVLTIVGSRC